MNIIKTEKNKVTAELFDSLADRVETVVTELGGEGLPFNDPLIFNKIITLADEYTPPFTNVSDIEDVYFLHYEDADNAYVSLQMGDGSEDDYMRGAVVALITIRACKRVGYEI